MYNNPYEHPIFTRTRIFLNTMRWPKRDSSGMMIDRNAVIVNAIWNRSAALHLVPFEMPRCPVRKFKLAF